MKKITYLIMLTFLVAIGCNNDSSNPTSTAKAIDPALPNSAATGSTSDAIFDIPNPTITTVSNSTISHVVGTGSITVCWKYATPANSYYTATLYKPQGNKPNRPYGVVPTATLNPKAVNSPYEFWGGSQRTIVSAPAYSGH